MKSLGTAGLVNRGRLLGLGGDTVSDGRERFSKPWMDFTHPRISFKISVSEKDEMLFMYKIFL